MHEKYTLMSKLIRAAINAGATNTAVNTAANSANPRNSCLNCLRIIGFLTMFGVEFFDKLIIAIKVW